MPCGDCSHRTALRPHLTNPPLPRSNCRMEKTDAQPPQPAPQPPPADNLIAGLKFDANGLVPAIVQDHRSGEVLMMAWMNRDALNKTLQTGKTHFFSRSRNRLWLKGESSGHVQLVKSVAVDCDQDVLLFKVEQAGAACHDGYYSCFYREFRPGEPTGAEKPAWSVVGRKVFDPEKVYSK